MICVQPLTSNIVMLTVVVSLENFVHIHKMPVEALHRNSQIHESRYINAFKYLVMYWAFSFG